MAAMADLSGYETDLSNLPPSAWPAYLDERSGLPGPRANLTLVSTAASRADGATIDALLAHGGEYQTLCAAAALARRADDPASEARARTLAADERWRVREGVAIGLQLLGDRSSVDLTRIVRHWVDDPRPLVQRAAIAAVCEPRLLRDPSVATVALGICDRATRNLCALPADRRRQADARTLRQGLGYCWSVAVAAHPEEGLPMFRALDTSDSDLAWIVNQNSRKKRLATLLG